MFERYTEAARRALFFSRYETSQVGGVAIETEHLLLGLLREDRRIVSRIFALANVSPYAIRETLDKQLRSREKVSTAVEIPFSAATKRVLTYAVQEADGLGHRHIGPEHLLLGLLRDEQSVAGATLIAHGLRLAAVRIQVAELQGESGPDAADSRDDADSVDAAEVSALIDRIHLLVDKLASMMPDNREARELKMSVMVELGTLKHHFKT